MLYNMGEIHFEVGRQSGAGGESCGGEACGTDVQCLSGVCGLLQAPSMGTGRACFEACTGSTVCAATMTCRAAGLQVATASSLVSLDSCAP
jgi:hypothetical protein